MRLSIVVVLFALLIAAIALPAAARTVATPTPTPTPIPIVDKTNVVNATITFVSSDAGWTNQYGYLDAKGINHILGDNRHVNVPFTLNYIKANTPLILTDTANGVYFWRSDSTNAQVTGGNDQFQVKFEDTPGLGDKDFNDMVVKVVLTPSLMDGNVHVYVADDQPRLPVIGTITLNGKSVHGSQATFDLSAAAQGTYMVTFTADDGRKATGSFEFHGGHYEVAVFVHWTAPHVDQPKLTGYVLLADTAAGHGYAGVLFGEHATASDYAAASNDLGWTITAPKNGVWLYKNKV